MYARGFASSSSFAALHIGHARTVLVAGELTVRTSATKGINRNRDVRYFIVLLQRQMVQHQVNHDTCNRHVKPDGEGDFRNLSVPVPVCLQAAIDRDDCKNWDHSRQNHVADQNCEVNDSDRPNASKRFASFARVMMQPCVVRQVTDQKNNGNSKCRQHDVSMSIAFALLDQQKTEHKQNRGQPVQRRVDCRQSRQPVRKLCRKNLRHPFSLPVFCRQACRDVVLLEVTLASG